MKKFVRTLFWSVVFGVLLIVIASVIISMVYKPQLMQLARTEINKKIEAKVNFRDINVSLIKGFPNLYVGLKDFSIVGIDSFKNDTLLTLGELGVKVNIWSVIDMQEIEVRSVLLSEAKVKAHVGKSGSVNWKVLKYAKSNNVREKGPKARPSRIKIDLSKFRIRNANIVYIDDSLSRITTVKNFNLTLSGKMAMMATDLKLDASASSLTVGAKGINYVDNANINFNAVLGADFTKNIYTFKKNNLRVNNLQLLFEGGMKMPDNNVVVNINFSTPSTDFKDLLSMVPVIYTNNFKGVEASGSYELSGSINGIVGDTILPNANVKLTVTNGFFQYSNLPKSAKNVNILAEAKFDGQNMDSSTVNIEKFHLDLDDNPFDVTLQVSNPVSDMLVKGEVNGKINFSTLSDVIPLDSLTVKGELVTDLKFGGKLSYIEKKDYDEFNASGKALLNNFMLSTPRLPLTYKIPHAEVYFTPKFAELKRFESTFGGSNLNITGKFENYFPYIFKDGILKGSINITSNLLNVNELLTGKSLQNGQPADTVLVKEITFPSNIVLDTKVEANRIVYDRLDVANFKGEVEIVNGIARLDRLSMNMLDGTVGMSGIYDPRKQENPEIDFDFVMDNVNISRTFNSFSALQKLAPQMKNMNGSVSTTFTVKSKLDSSMSMVTSSIDAHGNIKSKNVEITKSKVFGKIADILKKEEYRNPNLKDLNINFRINNGRIYFEPFNTKIADTKMNVGGDMGLDQTLNFKAKVRIPSSYLGGAASVVNQLLGNIGAAIPEDIRFNLLILGTSEKPDVRVDIGGDSK
ncbi:MAG: AsmA family protein [Bacteroidales bacterium]|nr:AsmA family protein [Bacteroidales bacterium]